MKYSFLKSFSQLFLLSTLSYILGFLGQVIISFYLGTSSSLDSYFTILAAAGFLLFYVSPVKDVFVKIVYEASADGADASKLFSSGLILQALLSLLSSCLFFVKPFWKILGTHDKDVVDYNLLLLFVPYFLLYALAETTNGLLLSFNKLNYQAVARLISSIIGLLFVIILAPNYGIVSLIISLQVTQLITTIISFVGLSKNGIRFTWITPSLIFFKSSFLGMLSSLLLSYLFSQIYVLVERAAMFKMTTGLVASYQYSVTLVNVGISMIVIPLINLVWPKFLEESKKGNDENIIKITENTIIGMSFLLLTGCLFVYINAYDVISLIFSRGRFDNKSIISTGNALRATIFTALPIGIYGILTKVLITRGHAKHLALAASSIAFLGIFIIIIAYYIGNTTLVMCHWLIGNTIGALFALYSVKKYFRGLFSDSSHWIKACFKIFLTVSLAAFISSLELFQNILQGPLLTLLIKLLIYSLAIAAQIYFYKIDRIIKVS